MSAGGRVCIFAPYLYPVMSGGKIEYAGGLEVQQALLARGLAARGIEVMVVTCDYGQPDRMKVDGVTLLRAFRPYAGLPVLRFLHPRLTQSVAALVRADADVYFMQGSGLLAGWAYEVARLRGRPFVFMAAHDFDTLRSMPYQTRGRERWWYRRALYGANLRIAQTEYQQQRFREEFGLDSTILPNPVEIPEQPVDAGAHGAVVWLATYKASKRPEWFTALARELPEHRFVMYGVIPEPPLTREAWEAARQVAAECPNLEVHGYIDHSRIGELFGRAALFVHTSGAEGFPNAVLEAWAHGLPSVSGVDPDGVVAQHGLGATCADFPQLVEAVRRLMADPQARRAAGSRARAYAIAHHGPDGVYDRLIALLAPLMEPSARRAGR